MRTRHKQYPVPDTLEPVPDTLEPVPGRPAAAAAVTPPPSTSVLPQEMAQLVASLNATLSACGMTVNANSTAGSRSQTRINEGASTSTAATVPSSDEDPEYSPHSESVDSSDVSGLDKTTPANRRKRAHADTDSSSSSSREVRRQPKRRTLSPSGSNFTSSSSSSGRHRRKRHHAKRHCKKHCRKARHREDSSSTSGNSSSSDEMPESSFNTSRVRLDLRVPKKLKRKIWRNEYVDLGHLLLASRKPGALFEKSHKKGKHDKHEQPVNSIIDWVSAFNVYIAVYTMKFAEEAPSIIHYVHTVMELARTGGDWHSYDHEFRVARIHHPCPWHELNSDLYVTYKFSRPPVVRPTQSQSRTKSSNAQSKRHSFPSGTCWRFHNGRECDAASCQYTHTCFQCSGSHPVYQCARQGQRNQQKFPANKFTSPSNNSANQRPGANSTTHVIHNANSRNPKNT